MFMRKIISLLFCIIFSFTFLSVYVYAHSGKTDSAGGHYNHQSGEYHYHHGYPAHSHIDDECPYDFDDKTDHSSNKSNSSHKYNEKASASMLNIVSEVITTIFESIIIFFIGISLVLLVSNALPRISEKVLIVVAILIGIVSIILAIATDFIF